ncbi:hypothetical protein [Paraburkholderia phosphatilytica]|uniref:hypothetical protein n=1 Tax=Paraburkholderia phosphatilytica TaxID=2282883 RepID=UPI001F0C7540|nr:hypothetical protein [Paraburkholderia phosphatilytica]
MSPDRADHPGQGQPPRDVTSDVAANAAAAERKRGLEAAAATPKHTRPSGWAVLIGLLLTPAAWFAQTNLAQTISAYACFPHGRPVAAPALPWLMHGLLTLSVLTFIAGAIGVTVGLRNWRRTAPLATAEARRTPPHRTAARDCFLARVGTISSCVFMFGLVASDMALMMVPPCGG